MTIMIKEDLSLYLLACSFFSPSMVTQQQQKKKKKKSSGSKRNKMKSIGLRWYFRNDVG